LPLIVPVGVEVDTWRLACSSPDKLGSSRAHTPWQMSDPTSCRFLRHSRCCFEYSYPSGLMVGITVNVKLLSSVASSDSWSATARARIEWMK
jgi:hypothetical protein